MIADYGKAGLFLTVTVMLGVLRALDAISENLFGSVLLIIVGYLVGNGVQALRGKAPSPVFVPKLDGAHPADPQLVATIAAVLDQRQDQADTEAERTSSPTDGRWSG